MSRRPTKSGIISAFAAGPNFVRRKDESVIRCILAVSESSRMGDTFWKSEESILGWCGGEFGEKGGVERAVGEPVR